MSRVEAVLSALGVFGVALVVRVLAASLIVFPKPEDTAYYVGVARNLVEGRGLITDALWSFQTQPLTVPREAFEVWLPLPSLIAALPMALARGAADAIPLDVAFRAAQTTSIVIGALVAVLAWRLAADVATERGMPVGRARTFAIGAGLAVAVYLPLLLHSALPDSTMPFTALALTAAILMARILRDPRGGRLSDPRLWALGLVLGLTALTRNEVAWIALLWVFFVVRAALPWDARIRMIGLVAALSLLLFVPWMARDWFAFGSPFPGQAVTNALSVNGSDIFAWNDQPTLARYLAVGPARLLEMRGEGVWHNLWSVLLSLGLPLSIIGVVALPWQARDRALRPLVGMSLLIFLATSLLFPVSTTWGTFLHAAGPVHVLLIISALGALDWLIVRVGVWRGWHRPVAWLGPALAVFGCTLFSLALLPAFGGGSASTERTYSALDERLAAVGATADADRPIIHDYPIWLAETARRPSVALPEESPADVIDLAKHFGAQWLLVANPEDLWPRVLSSGASGSDCFQEVPLGTPSDPAAVEDLDSIRLYHLTCVDDSTVRVP